MHRPHHVDALVAHKDGKFFFSADEGMAPCEIWAEINAHGPDGDYSVSHVFWGSSFTGYGGQELTGEPQAQATKILAADAGWQIWVDEEIARQSGFREPSYDRLKQVELV